MSYRTGLYRLYSADGVLLYVGISDYPETRLATHRRSAPWRDQIARHTVDKYQSRRAAMEAESEAINTEFPLFNKQGRRAEPKSVTLARKKADENAKAAARREMTRQRRAKDSAEQRLRAAVLNGREAGLTLNELANLSGYPYEEVRRMARSIAIRINGDSRTRAGREEKTA